MIVLGLVLVALATVAGTEIFLSNTEETTAEAFSQTLDNVSLGGFFLAGALTTLVLLFGISLINSGASRSRRRRGERKETEARQREIRENVEKERLAAVAEADRLREELAEERMNQATLGGVVPPPDIDEGSDGRDSDQRNAGPVSDPEHSRDDRRGVLGRLRKDRSEA
ncbi:MAG TPA: hypothetical protein VNB94_04110 [Mycobacteriales bacterium]|nr:hypothetical protein [Mycobacteriales bacterium]